MVTTPAVKQQAPPVVAKTATSVPVTAISKAVVKAGGAVTGQLRCSIIWNDGAYDDTDFDLHCFTPNGAIYFGRKQFDGGMLDVDIMRPQKDVPAVENIVFSGDKPLAPGTYYFFVNVYRTGLSRINGFSGEIEVAGKVYSFHYRERNINKRGDIPIAKIRFSPARGFEITQIGEVWRKKS